MPLFKLKAEQEFRSGLEHQKVFNNRKSYPSSAPTIVPLKDGIPFRLYLSADQKSIGLVLTQEQDGNERVIFHLSHRLMNVEIRYS
jgi:hypothetical protein